MSFKWNCSRDLSDRSFFTQGNEIIAPSIGLTASRTALSCRLNIEKHDYKYQQQALATFTVVQTKLKRWAFREIQKYTHYHLQKTKSIFLPEALSNGNYGVLTKFLENLRTNRVGAYIKLNLQESQGYFDKASTLLKPLSRLLKQRFQYAFGKLKRNMTEQREVEKNKILIDIEKFSSIQNNDSEDSYNFHPKGKVINVTYALVTINPQKINNRKSQYIHREFSTVKKGNFSKQSTNYIDLNDLIDERKTKDYQFTYMSRGRTNSQRGSNKKQI